MTNPRPERGFLHFCNKKRPLAPVEIIAIINKKTITKSNESTAMTNYKLPARKWYTLEQATKRIKQLTGEDIEIEDLLHYWQIGKLLISTNVEYSSKDLTINIGNITLQYISPIFLQFNPNEEEYIDIDDDYCSIKFNLEEKDIQQENIEDPFLDLISEKYDKIEGFLSIPCKISEAKKGDLNINKILKSGLDLNDFNEFLKPPIKYNENSGLLCIINPHKFEKKDNLTISIDNLYILEKDLIPFLNGEIEKYLKVLSDTYKEEQEKSEDKSKQFSKTIQENQINFIRALLYMDYGIETPQEVKNAINSGELGRKIEKFRRENPNIENDKNFKFPTSVTLSNWYSKA